MYFQIFKLSFFNHNKNQSWLVVSRHVNAQAFLLIYVLRTLLRRSFFPSQFCNRVSNAAKSKNNFIRNLIQEIIRFFIFRDGLFILQLDTKRIRKGRQRKMQDEEEMMEKNFFLPFSFSFSKSEIFISYYFELA